MHNLLIVVGDGSLREMMEPYWQDLEVEEYEFGEVTEWEKRCFLDFYGRELGEELGMDRFDDLYKERGEDWNDNEWRKDDGGVWKAYSTANPRGRWDWYEVGGRWAGWLKLKEGAERLAPLNFSWGWDKDLKARTESETPPRADKAYLKDIDEDYLDILKAGAILMDGEWTDIGEYEFAYVKPYLEGLPGDTLITCVDFHM